MEVKLAIRRLTVLAALAFSSSLYAGGNVLRVSATAAPGGDGQSWATALDSLQDALLIADGDVFQEIWVAEGIYKPDQGGKETQGDDFASFRLANHVRIYGGFFGTESFRWQRDPSANITILSGDLNGDDGQGMIFDNSLHVVTGFGVNDTSVIDGFVISNGYAKFTSGIEARGGGMYLSGAAPTINQIVFQNNRAEELGGALCIDGRGFPIIRSCDFVSNQCSLDGGAIGVGGGSGLGMSRCRIGRNDASDGAGLYMAGAFLVIANSSFYGSQADAGGGLYLTEGLTFLTNVLVTGNRSISGAGMQVSGDAEMIATNCTIGLNEAIIEGGGAFISTTGDVLFRNSILWGNVDNGGVDESAQLSLFDAILSIDTCRVQGWTGELGGSGNNGEDPLLIDPDGFDNTVGTMDDNYRLASGSSAIDAGLNSVLPSDGFDLDDDLDQNEQHPLDLDDQPRRIDDPFTADSPAKQVPPVVDIGAYEFFRDCNNNGIPDNEELASGEATDCNDNNILDECEINSCVSNPSCDDCNLNGLPDSCDIQSQNSQDQNEDGIPDECVFFTGNGGQGWGDPANWSNGQVPSDPDFPFAVTVEGPTAKVIVDVNVNIAALRILDGATVAVTQDCPCNLQVFGRGGLLNRGNLFVDLDKEIIVPAGKMTMGLGSLYRQLPDSLHNVSAKLTVDELVMKPTFCGSPEQLTLTGNMSLITEGDLTMDGGRSVACNTVAGGQTPPILKALPSTTVQVEGNFKTQGNADVSNDPPAGFAGGTGDFPEFMTVNGSVINESFDPDLYRLGDAGIVFNNGGRFEVAGADFGNDEAGFGVNGEGNFSLGRLELTSNTKMSFVNEFANTSGSGPCREALYVRELVLQPNSFAFLDGVKVYYKKLVGNREEQVFADGCGELVQVCSFDVSLVTGEFSNDCTSRPGLPEYAAFQSCFTGEENKAGLSPCCSRFDYNGDLSIDAIDYASYVTLLSGDGSCCLPNDSCGCEEPLVEYCVCEFDPFCCEVTWDSNCAIAAEKECLACP